MSSENSDVFTFSFQIWRPFISLSYLVAVARTASTMLKVAKVGILILFLILEEKAEYVSCQCVINGFYYVEICFFLYQLCCESLS